jgi:hypothetical protein
MPPRTHQTWTLLTLRATSAWPVVKGTTHAASEGFSALVVADQWKPKEMLGKG